MAQIKATLKDVMDTVFFSDNATNVKRTIADSIVETAMKATGFACLGGNTVHIDLGNGYDLICKVKKQEKQT